MLVKENHYYTRIGKSCLFLGPKSIVFTFSLNLFFRFFWNYTWWQSLKCWQKWLLDFWQTQPLIHFMLLLSSISSLVSEPAGIYLLKVNTRNTRARCEICSELTIKTPERLQWRFFFGVFTVNFEDISHLVLVFLLLTLNM